MDLYQQHILDYYKRPRRRGELAAATHQSAVANPSCGDSVQVALRVEGGKVTQARWQGEGCALSLAAADMLAEHAEGKTLTDVQSLRQDHVVGLLGLEPSPGRLRCALLPLEALTQAAGEQPLP